MKKKPTKKTYAQLVRENTTLRRERDMWKGQVQGMQTSLGEKDSKSCEMMADTEKVAADNVRLKTDVKFLRKRIASHLSGAAHAESRERSATATIERMAEAIVRAAGARDKLASRETRRLAKRLPVAPSDLDEAAGRKRSGR